MTTFQTHPAWSQIEKKDPNRTLVFVGGKAVPMGSVGTWGFEDTSYGRAVHDPDVMKTLARREGLPEGDPRLEERVGTRCLASDHKIATQHAGLVPESIRQNVAAYMGLSSKDKMAGRAPLGMQLQALVGSRYLAGLGVTLPTLFQDPRKLSLLASSGLPGTEKFIESARDTGIQADDKFVDAVRQAVALARSDTQRTLSESEQKALETLEAFAKNPVVGRVPRIDKFGTIQDTMRIAHILGSGVGTVFANMIGPRADDVEGSLLGGARTLGPEFHHTGECATFFGSVRAASLMLLADPQFFQVPDMVLVGAAEAGFGIPACRILSLLFDSMGAMEPTDSVLARGANLRTGYAPLTTDVHGFWPGEGAGMVGLTTAAFAMKHGLRINAELVALGASADQGGKTHPAALGKGGLNSLQWVLEVAKRAGIYPDYANLHGTGTRNNNEQEAYSLAQLQSRVITLFADKAISNHTLGAAGALALSGMLSGILRGVLPGAANIEGRTIDPEIDQSRFIISSALVTHFFSILLRSQGFWGNNEDQIILPLGEGLLAQRLQSVTVGGEIEYWKRVAENDARGSENIQAINQGHRTYVESNEQVRLA